MKRRPGILVVSVLFFLLAVNAFAQVARVALGWDTNPRVLTLWQVEIVALRPILDLEATALSGLIVGGVAALVTCLLLAWYVRRSFPRVEPDRD